MLTHQSPQLSIVIVNWNTKILLKQCLSSILARPPHCTFQIWVVDNASTDGSATLLKTEFSHLKCIFNEQNVGFAKANNQAIEQITSPYILLLNPDTEVYPNSLSFLVDFMSKHSKAGAAGARLLNPDGTLQTSAYKAPTLWREFWRLLHLDRLYPYANYQQQMWVTDKVREVDVLKGACMILRRDALAHESCFDEDFFIYSEEVDLCRRIQQAGWKLFWVPQAQILHYEGQSTKQLATPMFLNLYRSKLLYFRKYYGFSGGVIYKFILLFASLIRLFIAPIAYFEEPNKRRQHITLASRYWHLVLTLPNM